MKLAFTTFALLSAAAAQACPGLAADSAWVREAPPGSMMLAGYATLRNTGKKALTITNARSPDFSSVEAHESYVENGVEKMRSTRISIAPQGRFALKPGGVHLMLMQPSRELKAGDHIRIGLSCGHQTRTFTFTVKADTE